MGENNKLTLIEHIQRGNVTQTNKKHSFISHIMCEWNLCDTCVELGLSQYEKMIN
jgi:hypothetical protein